VRERGRKIGENLPFATGKVPVKARSTLACRGSGSSGENEKGLIRILCPSNLLVLINPKTKSWPFQVTTSDYLKALKGNWTILRP